jgi:peptide/nickel transport system substrate-binding protein
MQKTWRASDVVITLLLVVLCLETYLLINQADRNFDRLQSLVKQLASDAGTGGGGRVSTGAAGPKVETTAEKAKMGDWEVREFSAESATLNPLTHTDYYASIVLDEYLFDTLIDIDSKTLEQKGKMAESWTVSPDHLKITFKMRDGMKWSDGEPITSADVVFSFKTIKDPQIDAAPTASYFKDVESVTAVDRLTVEFKYARPYFKSVEICGGMMIIPEHVYHYTDAKKFNDLRDVLVGSGPYVFEEWKPGEEIVVRRNDRYYGKPAYFDKVVFKIERNETAAYQKTRAQEIDRYALTPEQYVKMAEDEKFLANYKRLVYSSPRNGYSYIGWNERSKLFQDARVRRALTMLVPRERMKKELFHDLVEVSKGPFWPGAENIKVPTQSDPTIKPWPYDPKRAMALLNEAGWVDTDNSGLLKKDGQPFKFQLMIPQGSQLTVAIAATIREELARVGIQMSVLELEWSVFEGRLKARNYEATMLSWGGGGIEEDPYQIWHSDSIENEGSNHIGFKNAEADRLITAARVEFDREKRNALFRQFDRLVYEEQPYTFMFTSKSRAAIHKRFEDVNIYPLGLDDTQWWTPAGQRLYTK